MGVFYIESPAMRRLQQKTRRGDFEHIVIHSSIIRPAANRYINDYVRRLRGEPCDPLHPVLDELLAETHGIMVYQEDVSKAAVAIAGFSDADADGLRKIMAKRNKESRLAEYRRMFFDGAEGNGVSRETTGKIWDMILSFDGYSFCKPHSASYAMVSFQSAYLKTHFPAEFMAAVISNEGGYYTASAYIGEARRMGLRILPPDLNESRVPYTGRDGNLRVGLMAVRGLRRETARLITTEREKGGPFTDLEDFRRRVPLLGGDAEALAAAGAADSLGGGKNRAEQLWTLLGGERGAGGGRQAELFSAPRRERRFPDPGERVRLKNEYARLGFLTDRSPLWFWSGTLSGIARIRGRDMVSRVGEDATLAGMLVTVKEILTIDGKPMEFVSFEDEEAIFETVFFPEAFRKYGAVLDNEAPFVLRGRIEDDLGAVSLRVDRVEKL
jgi:DNA polymerase III alpha subunit